MNDILKTIYERRAIRKYKDRPVEQNLVEQLLDAGRMAPSAINRQPWKFYVVSDKEKIHLFSKQIAKASVKNIASISLKDIAKSISEFIHSPHDFSFFKDSDFVFHGAPLVVFITSPRDNEWAALDIGMCAQNMMLAAKSLGLDSCPVGLAKFVEHAEAYSKLNIPESDHVQLALIFGYGDETPAVKERKKDNVFYV